METALRYAFSTVALLLVFGLVRATPVPDSDVLLKAINFALTGSDGITYAFTERAACVVRKTTTESTEPKIQVIQTFHLNNVDTSRIQIQRMQSTSEIGTERFIRVELHGEEVVWEYSSSVVPTIDSNETKLDLYTTEIDRVTRAWKYIYSHGCKSAHSSY